MTPARRISLFLLLAALLPFLPGCPSRIGGSVTPDEALNTLRSENHDLRDKVDELQRKIDLRLAEIDTLQQRLAAQPGATQPAVPGVKPSDIPHAVALKFDRYSGAVNTKAAPANAGAPGAPGNPPDTGSDDLIRLYIEPVDQQDRFLPVIGRAVVQVVAIAPGKPPQLIAEKTFTPEEFTQAYRAGLTGTHYTLEVPLPAPLPAGLKEATVKLTFTDAATGVTLSHEQAMPVRSKG